MRTYSSASSDPAEKLYAKIAPVDLCLAWGKLAVPENVRNTSFSDYSAGKRFCEFKPKAEMPFDGKYFETHISNNHIIPATENVYNAIKNINEHEKVALKGYLVNVYLGGNLFMKTSLTRKDEWDGACEVFYVEKVRIGNKIYE
jgi:hypothetical protein